MGCCLFALLALAGPRIVLVLLWLFSGYLSHAYGTWVIPLIGFFVLPLTTLAGAWVINSGIGVSSPLGLVVIVLAALIDLGTFGGGRYAQRRRSAYT